MLIIQETGTFVTGGWTIGPKALMFSICKRDFVFLFLGF